MPRKKAGIPRRKGLAKTLSQAMREQATILDLSERKLTELPREISQLAGLQELNLRGNRLTALPDWLGELAPLQWLCLDYNQLATVPAVVGRLINLRRLDLNGNLLTSLPGFLDQLVHLKWLALSFNRLDEVPAAIGRLTGLRRLYLSSNRLTLLPESLRLLVDLQTLVLNSNRLLALPEWIAELGNLHTLDLSRNLLSALPETLGSLAHLQRLDLSKNQLAALPESMRQLTALQALVLNNNLLTVLPAWIDQLCNLQNLGLSANQLTAVPRALVRLKKLHRIDLQDNPLNPALASAFAAGLDTLHAYLHSLDEPAKREELYEAKLVLVGEGGVGKTTLLRALTGQEPRVGEPTTHGVKINIQALRLPHPEKAGVNIQLNAWDFGGQEIYRVTHQFFFSKRSVYLLVWEPRMGVQQCQVEDWLKLIRLRVGDEARVIIVATHCRTGQRLARIDQPVFLRDFGSMIAGFHEVDSLVDDPATGEKVGLRELQGLIQNAAKDLEQMGMEFNRDWRESRDELLALPQPYLSYEEFAAVCRRHHLNEPATRALARLMHDLGYTVHYVEDERLQDFVVLQPEWLTKAIGFVLEDRATQESNGILPDQCLREVWWDHPFAGEPRYAPQFYPFFLRLMEKYDVSYRLESGDASLVAQHVPQVRPALPWLPEETASSGRRRIALVCVMEDAPPGLVPWLIVRTNEYAAGRGSMEPLHWQKGMFLRYRPHGEALVELRGRELHLYAEAWWPEFFMNVLRRTLHKLITDNWPGMKGRYYFAVPCPEKSGGRFCEGRFDIAALRQFLEEGDRDIRCQVCRKRQDLVALLYGFAEEDSRTQLRRIETKLAAGFAALQQEMAGLESRLANYVMAIMQAIAAESKEGPRLFTLAPADGNWKHPFAKQYRLQLWCEAKDCQHPVLEQGMGVYEVEATRDWLKRVAPYANFITGVLKTLLPLVAPAVNVYFGADTIKKWGVEDHLELAKEGADKLLRDLELTGHSRLREGMLSEAERSGVLALHAFLRAHDPHQERLGLKRMPTYTGDYLWLCRRHYEDSQSKIPDQIA
ncbi:hypothetical protein HUU39_13110 [candidate division KSB1 bacterium]|nr:ADP-ribosylation factor-like protein [bacterium]NUM66201.1 hypothetical protein [candidate division KSB1 bacterium]